MLCAGALVSHKADQDLYLVKGNPGTPGRVRLMRWSDGSVRTAHCSDTKPLSPEESYLALYSAAQRWHRRMGVLNDLPYSPRSGLIDELKKCITNSFAYEGSYQHSEPGGAHLYRHDFIREYIISYSWCQVHEEKFITNDHIIRRAKAYCVYIGIDLPLDSLIRRRLARYWRSVKVVRRRLDYLGDNRNGA